VSYETDDPPGDTGTRDKKNGGDRTADCIIYSIKAIKNPAPASPPPPPPPPYATGKCSLHLSQTRSDSTGGAPYGDSSKAPDFFVTIDIFDNNKANIGHHDSAAAGAGNSLSVTGKLADSMVITPENRGDYIQFTLGAQSWASSDGGKCTVGNWDPAQSNPAVNAPSRLVM